MKKEIAWCVFLIAAVVLLGAGTGNSESPSRLKTGTPPALKATPAVKLQPSPSGPSVAKGTPETAASVEPNRIDCAGRPSKGCNPKIAVKWNLPGKIIYVLIPSGSSLTSRKSGISLLNPADRTQILQNISSVKEGVVRKKKDYEPSGRDFEKDAKEAKERVQSTRTEDIIQKSNAEITAESGGIAFETEPLELAVVSDMREAFCNDIARTHLDEQCPRMKAEQCKAKCLTDLHIARFKKGEGVNSAQFRISNKPVTPIRLVECSTSDNCSPKSHDLLVTVAPNYYREPIPFYRGQRFCHAEFHMEGLASFCAAWRASRASGPGVPCPGQVIQTWGDAVGSTRYEMAYWGNDDVATVTDSCEHIAYPPTDSLGRRSTSELDARDRTALGLGRDEFDWAYKSRWWWDGQSAEYTYTNRECHEEPRQVNCREEVIGQRPCPPPGGGNFCEETSVVCDTEWVEVCENEEATYNGYCGGRRECDLTIEDRCGNVTHRSYWYACDPQ